jgi:hypothetical protein
MAAPSAAVQHGGAGFQGSSKTRPPDAMKPDIQCVRTHWIRGFMAFPKGRPAWNVLLMVSVSARVRFAGTWGPAQVPGAVLTRELSRILPLTAAPRVVSLSYDNR